MGALQLVTDLLGQLLKSRAALTAENLALRHQVVILQRSVKRLRLHRRDRIFWVWLSRLRRGWRSSLLVAQLETVIRWLINEGHLLRVLREYFAYYHDAAAPPVPRRQRSPAARD